MNNIFLTIICYLLNQNIEYRIFVLIDINVNSIKQKKVNKTAAKRKKGPDSVPEMHLRNPKRARNDNGKNE